MAYDTLTAVVGTLPISTTMSAPKAGEDVTSASVKVGEQKLLNDVATLDNTKVNRAGDTMTGDLSLPNNTLSAESVQAGTDLSTTGAAASTQVILPADLVQIGASGVSVATLHGRWTFQGSGLVYLGGRKRVRARVTIADAASKTCGVAAGSGVDYAGDRFNLPGATAAGPRVIVLKSTGTGTAPEDSETLTFFCIPVGLSYDGSFTAFSFVDESAVQLAHVVVPINGGTFDLFWLRFEYTGGAWELSESSGVLIEEGAGPPALREYGVFPS